MGRKACRLQCGITLGFSGAARLQAPYVAGNIIEKMLSPRPLQAIVMFCLTEATNPALSLTPIEDNGNIDIPSVSKRTPPAKIYPDPFRLNFHIALNRGSRFILNQ